MTRSAGQAGSGAQPRGAARSSPTRSTPTRWRRPWREAEPEVIVHQLTALSGALDLRHFERDFALTNRLRTEGTDHLLAAGRAVGRRALRRPELRGLAVRAQRRPGQDRGRPARPRPAAGRCARTLEAIRHLEDAVTGAGWTEGIVLRYGGFYGPGTSFGLDPRRRAGRADPQAQVPDRRRRRRASGRSSTSRTPPRPPSTAIERGERGDLQRRRRRARAGRASGCPALATALGARKPPCACRAGWAGSPPGEAATVMMTEVRGASNAKAKRELGWQPRYPSWRQGFARGARLSDGTLSRSCGRGRSRSPTACSAA